MKFEKTLFKVSYREMFFFLVITLIANGAIFIFTWIKGNPRLLLNDGSWGVQFVFPTIYSILLTAVNRRGILKVSMFDDSKALKEKIESVVLKKGYTSTYSNTQYSKFIRKSKLGRFFNTFFNENIEIKVTEDEASIFARKNMLDSVKMKLKFNTI